MSRALPSGFLTGLPGPKGLRMGLASCWVLRSLRLELLGSFRPKEPAPWALGSHDAHFACLVFSVCLVRSKKLCEQEGLLSRPRALRPHHERMGLEGSFPEGFLTNGSISGLIRQKGAD